MRTLRPPSDTKCGTGHTLTSLYCVDVWTDEYLELSRCELLDIEVRPKGQYIIRPALDTQVLFGGNLLK